MCVLLATIDVKRLQQQQTIVVIIVVGDVFGLVHNNILEWTNLQRQQ